MIGIPCFKIDENDNFIDVETSDVDDKAEELESKFGGLAIDVVDEILDVLKYEDNRMYDTIKFYNDVRSILVDKLFEEYLINVREQLECNTTEEYKSNYIIYGYTNEQVDNNLDYFKKSMESKLSTYKALLNFNDYLNGEFKIEEI